MSFARIEIDFIGQPSVGNNLSFQFDGSAIFETASIIRAAPLQYEIGYGSYTLDQLAIFYLSAFFDDYLDTGKAYENLLTAYLDASGTKVIIEAVELGHYFQYTGSDSYIDVTVVGESADFFIESVTAEAAQVDPVCTSVRRVLTFVNAAYPVQLTSPVTKTINNASEAWFEHPRQPGAPVGDISCTDNNAVTDTVPLPLVDTFTIDNVIVNEGLSEANIEIEYSVVKGSLRGTPYEFRYDAEAWQTSPIIADVPIGSHTAYVRDSLGCEKSLAFEVVGGVSMPPQINLVAKDQHTKISFKVENPTQTENLRFNLYVYIPRINGSVEVAKKTLEPVETSTDVYEAEFDINNVLWGEIQNYLDNIDQYPAYNVPFFTFPGDPDNPLVKHDELLLDWFINTSYSYSDTDGSIVEASKSDNEGLAAFTRYAMVGGLSRLFRGYLDGIDTPFIDYLRDGNTLKFLSWLPDGIPVHPNQPLRLWVLNNNVMNGLNVKLKVYWTGGAESSVIDKYSLSESFGLFELACGPAEMRVYSADITRTVVGYAVWIEDDNGLVLTEVKQFTIDTKYYQRNDIFFFKTSLGVYEVLWAHGRRGEGRDVERKESDRPLQSPQLNKGTIVAERSRFTIPYTHNTGYFPKALRQWLTEFITSEEVVLPSNFFLIPMVLTGNDFDFGKDDTDMFSLSFGLKVGHLESQYSDVPQLDSPWNDFNLDFNNDYFI